MEPEAIAHAEAARALNQQRSELEHLRGRATSLLGAAGIVTSLFAGLAVTPHIGLHGLQWLSLGLFLFVAACCLLIQVPWKVWGWLLPGEALVRDYVDEPNRTTGAVMERDLAIHLGENLVDNNTPLNRLYFVLIAGMIGLGFEVLFWLLSM